MIKLTINGKTVEIEEGATIMEAAAKAGIKIPSLCHLKDVHTYGSCRICVVEVDGMKNLQASCIVRARDGMVVHTNSPKVRAARKVLYELLLSDHPKDCLSCNRNQNCELQELGYELGITETRLEGERSGCSVDISPSITRDTSKCILCRRCVTVCNEIQHVGAIQAQNRGFDTVISPAMGLPLNSTACAMCG
ncbi:2Fe-2S iron-sulfur cluster-binding protein, partial [Hungatella effluvii]